MDIQMIERDSQQLQQPVAIGHIQAICLRAFGSKAEIEAIHELSGGSINNTYLLALKDHPKIILRVAPSPTYAEAFNESYQLRYEYQMQPFFAPVAEFMPQTLMADFTHQIINRDYLLQTYLSGKPWSDIHDDLTREEQTALYHQLGSITRRIHAVTGETFGALGRSFPTWGQTMIAGLERVIHNLEKYQLDTHDITVVLAIVKKQLNLFDEIKHPQLLHGDLWHPNILIQRTPAGPLITSILDTGFAGWGDPPSDWTMIRLALRPPEESATFWKTYGALDQSPAAQFRASIYCAYSLGGSLIETLRLKQTKGHIWVHNKLHDITLQLQARFGTINTQQS